MLKCKPNLTSQLRTLNLNSSQIQYKWLKDGKQIIYSSKMVCLHILRMSELKATNVLHSVKLDIVQRWNTRNTSS